MEVERAVIKVVIKVIFVHTVIILTKGRRYRTY